MPKYIKCPKCDINHIQEGEEACSVCKPSETTHYTARRGKNAVKIPKPKAEGNIAFKCNYCDGGKNATQLGYAGICSKANIRENIEAKKRAWCGDSGCKCRQFLNGEKIYADITGEYPCYESRMLIDWKAQAGMDRKEGERRGRCRRLSKNTTNGLSVLTTVTQTQTEEERMVLGVFIIDKVFEGDEDCEEGFVQCTTKYKMKLSPAEAERVLFWNYYSSPNDPNRPNWASGLYRYLDDYQCAQILRDIVAVKKGTVDETLASEILNHYCGLKGIDKNTIPDNNGALTR